MATIQSIPAFAGLLVDYTVSHHAYANEVPRHSSKACGVCRTDSLWASTASSKTESDQIARPKPVPVRPQPT